MSSLGRTEDVCFSPCGRRLAIAAFLHNRIAVFDVDLSRNRDGVHITITSGVLVSSSALKQPHGLAFLDADTLIVTNRCGNVCLFHLPAGTPDVPQHDVLPDATWFSEGSLVLRAPGSVYASRIHDEYVLLICDNAGDVVTRHRLDSRLAVIRSEVLLRKWLGVPDSITQSDDGRWLAVSNHNSHQVFLYDASASLDENTDPIGILRGVNYPHGLRFSPDGRHLFLADAGAPYLHIYSGNPEEWAGVRYPVSSLRIMDDETFMRGRHNSQEGGPKGMALDAAAGVLAVTSEYQPLAWFDVIELLDPARPNASAREQRQIAMATELNLLKERANGDEATRETNALFEYMRNSVSWRLTAPLRRLDSLLRNRR